MLRETSSADRGPRLVMSRDGVHEHHAVPTGLRGLVGLRVSTPVVAVMPASRGLSFGWRSWMAIACQRQM